MHYHIIIFLLRTSHFLLFAHTQSIPHQTHLCIHLQSSLLPQLERFLKQSLVDKDPHVASAALVSGIHLMKTSPDLVCNMQYHQ